MSTIEISFIFNGPSEDRLDRILLVELAARGHEVSRSQIKKLIEEGAARVEDRLAIKSGTSVRPNSEIKLLLAEPTSEGIPAYDFQLDILHEDEELIVLNKPSGISMHPGAGNKHKTLVNALVHYFGPQRPELFREGIRPGIVHRLDRDTTGVIVVAKTSRMLTALAAQFARRTVRRSYTVLVYTSPRGQRVIDKSDHGVIESQLGRDIHDRKRMAVVSEGGKLAITNWVLLEKLGYGSVLEVRLGTGRTHQIRVHMQHIGSPVIGDMSYGDFSGLPQRLRLAAEKFGRQALHASSLEFVDPRSSTRLSFQSQIPVDMQTLIDVFRGAGA